MKINELISTKIYRWVSDNKLKNYIFHKVIPASWKHYIESEGTMIKGSSWSPLLYRWSLDLAFCIEIDLSEVPNKYYEINGHRTYLQTKAKTDNKGIFDPNAYKLEDTKVDEIFIEGDIKFISPPITKILIRKHKISTVTDENVLLSHIKKMKIPYEYLEN